MKDSREIPKEEGIDHSLTLLREGYLFVPNRRKAFASDIFETRLLGKKAICLGGKEAAELFYDNEKFIRNGAAPNRVKKTLFGEGAVQTLDGPEHRNRKAMLLAAMAPECMERLKDITQKCWQAEILEWEKQEEIIVYEEAKKLLCKIACEWAGVPLVEGEEKQKSVLLGKLFESPAAMGPEHWAGRRARREAEEWIERLVKEVRSGQLNPPKGSALQTFSFHKDLRGELLDAKIVAVEVINVLRPIIAISVYLSFTALAVIQYPQEREKLDLKEEKYKKTFIQEVRRFYPFFPTAVAKVKKDFTWKGYPFEEGTLTLLDLYGTNHDPNLWENPELFRPERFLEWQDSTFSFIPQGGGEFDLGHRCAGEWVTIEIMKISLDFFVNRIDFDVPQQDLSFSFVEIPSIPKSKIRLRNVRRK